MTHPKGLRLANETYAREGAEPIVVMKTREELMQNLVQGCEEQALMDEVAALKAENERLRVYLEVIAGTYGPNHLSKFARDTALAALKGGAA